MYYNLINFLNIYYYKINSEIFFRSPLFGVILFYAKGFIFSTISFIKYILGFILSLESIFIYNCIA